MKKLLLLTLLVPLSLGLASGVQAQDFMAVINAGQQIPPNQSPANGVGCFSFDSATGMLSYDITFNGLLGAETAAHIHGPAPVGLNAGVNFGLPVGSPKIGAVGPLNVAQAADLNAELLYVNIHTSMFPGGEIRGQIVNGDCSTPVEEQTWGRVKSMFR